MIKLLHIPSRLHFYLSHIWMILLPIFMIGISFLIYLLPIQAFFPGHIIPDAPIILLFCLSIHQYALFLIPIFLLFAVIFETIFMMPTASLFLHYLIFIVINWLILGYFTKYYMSFKFLFFCFSLSYFITLYIDLMMYAFLYNGFMTFSHANMAWLGGNILFFGYFFILYNLILKKSSYI